MKKNNQFENSKNNIFVNINGAITDAQSAKVSVFDRGFLYGDSIYEVVYSQNGVIIFLNDHIDRLYNSANILKIDFTFSREELISQILKTAAYSNIKDAYIRIIITRGQADIDLDPNSSDNNNVVIIVKNKKDHAKTFYENGIKLFIPNIVRNNINSVNPNAKSGNYLNNVMAISEAKSAGADDGVMKNSIGNITEGTSFNIWIVKNGMLKTPPVSSGLLKGITREKVLNICEQNKFNINTDPFNEVELLQADEVFITSSTRGIMPVHMINDTIFGSTVNDWPITIKVAELLKEKIKDEANCMEYKYI